MALIEFDFNGEKINIPINKETPMEQVLNIFEEKAGVNKNNLVFLYSGKKMNNYQLTFDQIANRLDKERSKMNIVVTEMENNKINTNVNDYNSNLFDFTQNLSETNYSTNLLDPQIYSSTESNSAVNIINSSPEYITNTYSEPILYDNYDNTTVTETPLYSNTIANSEVTTPTIIDSSEPIFSQIISELVDNSNTIQNLNTTSMEETPINISSELNTSPPFITTEISNEPIYTTTTISQVQQIPFRQVPTRSYSTTIQEPQEYTNPTIVRPTIVRSEITELPQYNNNNININTSSSQSPLYNPPIFINNDSESQIYTTSVNQQSPYYSRYNPVLNNEFPNEIRNISTSSSPQQIKESIPIQPNLTFFSESNNYNNEPKNIEPLNPGGVVGLPPGTLVPVRLGNSIVYVKTLPLNFGEKDRENNFSNLVPIPIKRSSYSNNNLFNSSNEKPLSSYNSPKFIRIKDKNSPEIPSLSKKPISSLFNESSFSPNNILFNSSNEKPLSGYNSPKFIRIKNKNSPEIPSPIENLFNSSNKKDSSKYDSPLRTIFRNDNKPIESIPFKSPLSSNNNLFNSSNEKPLFGCNCPMCTRLRNENKREIPTFNVSSSPPKNNLFKSSKEESPPSLRRYNRTYKALSDRKNIRDKPKKRIFNLFGLDPRYDIEAIDINEAFGVWPYGIRDKKKRNHKNITILLD